VLFDGGEDTRTLTAHVFSKTAAVVTRKTGGPSALHIVPLDPRPHETFDLGDVDEAQIVPPWLVTATDGAIAAYAIPTLGEPLEAPRAVGTVEDAAFLGRGSTCISEGAAYVPVENSFKRTHVAMVTEGDARLVATEGRGVMYCTPSTVGWMLGEHGFVIEQRCKGETCSRRSVPVDDVVAAARAGKSAAVVTRSEEGRYELRVGPLASIRDIPPTPIVRGGANNPSIVAHSRGDQAVFLMDLDDGWAAFVVNADGSARAVEVDASGKR
jgi:hypothetical protein